MKYVNIGDIELMYPQLRKATAMYVYLQRCKIVDGYALQIKITNDEDVDLIKTDTGDYSRDWIIPLRICE
jgi:hypothetical protein